MRSKRFNRFISFTFHPTNVILTQFKIGITGGIGSGKSFVSEIIEHMGFPVFYSDTESKKLVSSDLDIHRQLVELVGDEVFVNGELNKPFLAEKLFNSESIRQTVNAIIHPKVQQRFEEWTHQTNSKLVFNEAAILFETGGYKRFDKTILVSAPEDLRIKRVIARDHSTAEAVKSRMATQWSDEQKAQLADFIVINDGRPVLIQIENILTSILEKN